MHRPAPTWVLCFMVISIMVSSCTKFETKDNERKEREDLRTLITALYPTSLDIEIKTFSNQTGLTDLSYLEVGLASLIADEIRPIENEKTYVPYRFFPVEISSNIIALMSKSNSQFTNYLVSTITISTQDRPPFETNFVTNIITNSKMPNSSKWSLSTNFSSVIQTNDTLFLVTTNTQSTLPLSNYYTLIETVYPDLTNQLSFYPMKICIITNQNENTNQEKAEVSDQIPGNASNDIKALPQTNSSALVNRESRSGTRRPGKNPQPDSPISLPSTNLKANASNAVSIQTTNISSQSNIQPKYYFVISGSYTLISRKVPYELNIQLKLSNVNFTNRSLETSARSREDQLTSMPQAFHKNIRRSILNRPGGDLWIETDPAGANVYLDSCYIGKTPLYFPAVPEGEHFISLLKEKYQQFSFKTVLTEDKTNVIRKSLSLFNTGGTVEIDSNPTNSKVYLDSYFQGSTPIVLSNLALGIDHRLKIEPILTNLYPAYTNVLIRKPADNYQFRIEHLPYEGSPQNWKDTLWYSTYGSWFLTLSSIGLWIAGHALSQHYYDLYVISKNTSDWSQYQVYYNLSGVGQYAFYVTGVVSMGMTAWALSTEQIHLGDNIPKRQDNICGLSVSYHF